MVVKKWFRLFDATLATRTMMAVAAAAAVLILQSNVMAYTITRLAVDDTWVREDTPTSNRNDNDQMNLRTDIDADDNDAILLRFDVSNLPGPAGGKALLRLFWQRTTTDSEGKIMEVYGINEGAPRESTWTDDLVIYGEAANPTVDDAPGMIPDDLDPSEELAADANASDAELHDLDVANTTFLGSVVSGPAVQLEPLDFMSEALTDFINADTDGSISLLLFRDATDSSHQLRFIPSEIAAGANMPEISPTLQIVPEPASLALLALGCLTFAAVRRR